MQLHIRIIAGLTLAALLCLLPLGASALEEDSITAAQAVVYDTASDTVLFEQAVSSGKVCPASITKLFSAWVALQYLREDLTVTAGDELALVGDDSSVAQIQPGHTLTVAQLVEGMLLPSGNDAAYVLAAAAGRKIAEAPKLEAKQAVRVFVAEMNAMARELGLTDSHFMNSDGFHMGGHYSSLRDLIAIAELALETPAISRCTGIFQEDVTFVSGEWCTWKNTNALLDPESEFYHPEARGLKTGFTSQAGNCLLSCFRQEEGYLIVGVFGCPTTEDRFRDTLILEEKFG